ncbi:hypothetical protein BANRA_05391 [Escherichia coli]|nr:hypothetical protein BANRA_05391 [Escherichia coli]
MGKSVYPARVAYCTEVAIEGCPDIRKGDGITMKNDELATRRAQAIAEDRCFSKGRLRDEFRMKPAPGAEPVNGIKTLMVAGSLYTELQTVFRCVRNAL